MSVPSLPPLPRKRAEIFMGTDPRVPLFACYLASGDSLDWDVHIGVASTLTQDTADDFVRTFKEALQAYVRPRG